MTAWNRPFGGKPHRIAAAWSKGNQSALWVFSTTDETCGQMLQEIRDRYNALTYGQRWEKSARELRYLYRYTQGRLGLLTFL